MVEIVESAAERKERKRLKKLKKLEKLAAQQQSESTISDDSPLSSDVDSATKKLASAETPEAKKERKRLKKLAKMSVEQAIEVQATTEKKKDKKKKKSKTETGDENSNVKKEGRKKKKDESIKENSNPSLNVKKEGKKRKNEESVKENLNQSTENAWSKMMNKKKTDGEPVAKKIKQDKEVKKMVIPEEKETGVFKKIFYKPTEATINMPDEDVEKFRSDNKMNVTGNNVAHLKPILEFKDFCEDPSIMSVCKTFSKPTPIQSQCWPIIGSGRDIIGIAETGSGKTLAFSLPALQHMLYRYDNPVPAIPKNPIMLVLSPTRELAMQTQVVMEQAGGACYIRSVCCYGGVPKWEQKKALRWGVEVVVATPGRLKDLVQMGCVSLAGVSYLVLDEADRMLDQGFEQDIRDIISKTHKERQTCLFSATWPEAIRNLAHEFLTNPVKVTVGSDDLSANKRIKQVVEVIDENDKDEKVLEVIQKYTNTETKNRMIIFVLKKAEAHDLEDNLWHKGFKVRSIHGDKTQWERERALGEFKAGRINILVATDVAARGLDIPDVEYVINYSFPQTIEDYVHRIGRTGRAGKDGLAHSFFTRRDRMQAGSLVHVLKEAGQEVPKEMLKFDLRIRGHTFNKFFNKDGNSRPPSQCFTCGDTGCNTRICPQNKNRFGGKGGNSFSRGGNSFSRGGRGGFGRFNSFRGNGGGGGSRGFGSPGGRGRGRIQL